jgi:hypothetical protein
VDTDEALVLSCLVLGTVNGLDKATYVVAKGERNCLALHAAAEYEVCAR